MHNAQLLFQRLDSKTIGIEAKAADNALAGSGNHRVVAELLTLMNVRDVHLNDWRLQRTDAVVQGNGGMRIGTGIQHDTVVSEADLLHLVDEFALNVALVILDLDAGILGLQLGQILLEG